MTAHLSKIKLQPQIEKEKKRRLSMYKAKPPKIPVFGDKTSARIVDPEIDSIEEIRDVSSASSIPFKEAEHTETIFAKNKTLKTGKKAPQILPIPLGIKRMRLAERKRNK
jgi:hypothetical protein